MMPINERPFRLNDGARHARGSHCIFWLIAALILAFAQTASAHHVVSESGLAWAEPVSAIEMEIQTARFDLGSQQGNWQTLALRAQFAIRERASLSVRLPWSLIRFDDGRGALGLGDIETALQVKLISTQHGGLIASTGLGVEWPTGVADDYLGSGHIELTPFLIASSQLHRHAIITGVITYRTALEQQSAKHATTRAATGSVLSPHSAREVTLRVDASLVKSKAYYASMGMEAIYMIQQTQPNPIHGRFEVGWLPSSAWRLAIGTEYPLSGEKRFDWKGRINLAYMF